MKTSANIANAQNLKLRKETWAEDSRFRSDQHRGSRKILEGDKLISGKSILVFTNRKESCFCKEGDSENRV